MPPRFGDGAIVNTGGNMKRNLIALAVVAAGIGLGVAPVAPVHAEPGCVYPDGSPCTPAPQGCVLPENQLPCSSQLQDINAAIRQQLGQVLGGVLG
jgi:hypothetical protein